MKDLELFRKILKDFVNFEWYNSEIIYAQNFAFKMGITTVPGHNLLRHFTFLKEIEVISLD